MATNMLSLPTRKTRPLSLTHAITQYISTKYDQHPDMFTQDLQAIDQLRAAAISAQEPHATSIRKLQAYAAQLVWIGGKFPIDIGVDFIWCPALGYHTDRPISQNNIRFELANIVFNIAAMYSQLAISSNRSTADGLKAACNYFSSAAGVIAHLKTSIIPEMRSTPPEDMEIMPLECLEQLLLAQAQECFWQKAVKDGLKDASIAKLAIKVSDFYYDASEFGRRSDAISSEWLHHMVAKQHHFAAAAQYRAACDCLEKRRYGEEVARLRDALQCANDALKEQRYVSDQVRGDLNGLKSRVQEDLKRAEKDNDVIYLQPVPDRTELRTLDRASMVMARTPREVSDPIDFLGDKGTFGTMLFTKLVPYAVHVATSLYVERRDQLINTSVIDQLELLNASLHEMLASLSLPGSLQAVEKPLGLPPGLVSHADEIKQQDGMNRVYRSVQETERLRDNDRSLHREGAELLEVEAAEDGRARQRYGTDRWTRPDSKAANAKVYESYGQIEGYLKAAITSDSTVSDKIRENERNIRLLAGPTHDLEHHVPSTRRINLAPAVEQAIGRLRTTFNEVTRLESRRTRKVEGVKQKAQQDNINPSLLKEAARLEREYPMQKVEAAQFEDFFDTRLTMYDEDKNMVAEEEREQQQLLKRLVEANTNFASARKGDTSTRERERVLQSLETSYAKYKEIVSNLDQARRFYNDLAKIVTRFRDDCRTFVQQRRDEAQQIESDIALGMASLSLQSNRMTDALHQQKRQQESNGSAVKAAKPIEPAVQRDPIPAPKPQRPVVPPPATLPPGGGVWNPEMPIKFADAAPTDQANPADSRRTTRSGAKWDPTQGVKFG